MHCMQRGLATKKLSVRPSVCLSVKRVICDKMKVVPIFLYHVIERLS